MPNRNTALLWAQHDEVWRTSSRQGPPGGFDYTNRRRSGWMKEAGFRETRVEHLLGPDSMVVGIK